MTENISQKLWIKWNFELSVFELTVFELTEPDLYQSLNLTYIRSDIAQ